MTLAPIYIPTYVRIDHLRQAVEALKKNRLAGETEVYVVSDGARAGDEDQVSVMRQYLRTISGFKRIEIIENQANSYPDGIYRTIRDLLNQYGKLIFMEDDIVTAPAFLEFMNRALDVYQDNQEIFSISGYCPPIKIPRDYLDDVFRLPRFCAWGFGIWKDRFDSIQFPMPKEEILRFTKSWKNIGRFGLGGLDMINQIKKDALGKIEALDAKAFYYQYLHNMDTVYPVQSLVQNVGLDGSGVHSVKSNLKIVELASPAKHWTVPTDVKRNKRIIKNNFMFQMRGAKKFRPSRGNIYLIPYLVSRLIYFLTSED